MAESDETTQGSTKEKLKNFANRSKEELKKFGSRSKEELKKFGTRSKEELKRLGNFMTSGYSLEMEKLIKYTAYITFGLGLLAYLIHAGMVAYFTPLAWGSNVWILIFPIVAGVLYLLFVQKPLESNTLDDKTYIFLIICTGLACAALFWPGIPLFILFIEICVGSDAPFWKVLTEPQPEAPTKPKPKPQPTSVKKSGTKSTTKPTTKPTTKTGTKSQT